MKPPYIIVVAGPNGIGKTTFAKWYLRMFADCELIVDPDAIARELINLPESERNVTAGRIALTMINERIEQRRSFAIETTLSGKTLAKVLHRAHELKYYIAIRLLWVPSVRITIERVEMRRQNGGHSIGLDDQLRRFDRCYINFFTIYRRVCHDWELYLGIDESNESFARGEGGLI